jgi:glycine cleavage system H protein
LNGKIATVGITDHAQKEISDVVFVELPKTGRSAKKKDSVMVIESVKAAFDIYAPVSGKIVEVNEKLTSKPETVNASPYGEGWLYKIECSDPAEWDALMTEEQYKNAASHSH